MQKVTNKSLNNSEDKNTILNKSMVYNTTKGNKIYVTQDNIIDTSINDIGSISNCNSMVNL